MRALHKVSTSIPVISWIISAAFSLLFTVCPTGVGVQLEPPSGRYFLHILVTMKGQPKEEKPVPQSTGNVALWHWNRLLTGSRKALQSSVSSLGSLVMGLAAPDSLFVLPLLLFGLFLFLCLCLFPVAPLFFFSPSVAVLSHHPSVLFSVRQNPKGFVWELVLSGTCSLTPLALFQPVSLSRLHRHKHNQTDPNTVGK